jgi:hypothetical protein
MRIVEESAAQGDIMLIEIDELPPDAVIDPHEDVERDRVIVAHSETGHHHVATGRVRLFKSSDPLVTYLEGEGDIDLVHERSFDTHETIRLAGRKAKAKKSTKQRWQVRRQRESAPQGWRRVAD